MLGFGNLYNVYIYLHITFSLLLAVPRKWLGFQFPITNQSIILTFYGAHLARPLRKYLSLFAASLGKQKQGSYLWPHS